MSTESDCTFAYYYTGSGNVREIYVKDTRYSSADDFKTAMDNHYICYPLATPTETQLTPETIALLKGNNVITTDGDNAELKYSVSLDSLLPT